MPIDKAVALTVEQRLQEAFGTVTLPFSRGGTVVARINRLASESVFENNAINLQRVMTLKIIAGQITFPIPTGESEPVEPGDSFTYLSRVYEVMNNGVSSDSSNQVYIVRCIERKRDSQGVA